MEFQDKEEHLVSLDYDGDKTPRRYDNLFLGTTLGLAAPLITMLAYYLYNFNHIPVAKFIDHLFATHVQSSLLSLCVVSNLFVFFLFIWTERYKSARGVLFSTFLYGGLVVYLKFFI